MPRWWPLSKVISIFPSPPGGIGSFEYSVAVQPQLVLTLAINRSALPVLLNLKTQLSFSPWINCPKSCSVFVKLITGMASSELPDADTGLCTIPVETGSPD